MFGLDITLTIVLILCVVAVCCFEFINGFHDTANAVATVIYTRSLKPRTAIIWSGVWNFIGVYFGGIAVAVGIINLLPIEALVDKNVFHSVAMVASLIITAIIWNLGTWYFGIPCSSSHTMIGSIFGIGIGFMFISTDGSIALNFKKVMDAGLSLLFSPIFGFGLTFLLLRIFRLSVKKNKFFNAPNPKKKPPFYIRGLLVVTSTAVSFSHGSNDGQKGVGLMMIIFISILPSYFAIDPDRNPTNMLGNVNQIELYMNKIDTSSLNVKEVKDVHVIKTNISTLKSTLLNSYSVNGIPKESRFTARQNIIEISRKSDQLFASKECPDGNCLNLTPEEKKHFKSNLKEMRTYTEFAPWWVLLLISVSLGVGTMIGWKRIAVTIGEKIGKTPLTYAQGTSSGMVAASTIAASSLLGLPVSTTHVLSSGIAGSMVSEGGWKNLQYGTLKNILISWIITLPVTIALSCGLFLLFRYFVN